MATKWYLRNTTTAPFPTSGEKSTVEPVAASTFGLTPTDRDLQPAKGTTATSATATTNASVAAQNGCLGRWSSFGLVAGTYGSGTWSLAVQTSESSISANTFSATASIYFWRPSTSAVVGFVNDADTVVGVEFGNNVAATRYGQVLSITGSNVTIAHGDILVIELWTKFTQAAATAFTLTVYYDGTTDVTSTYALTDPASFLQSPVDIPLYAPGVMKGRVAWSPTG